jgi:hypothetical protein
VFRLRSTLAAAAGVGLILATATAAQAAATTPMAIWEMNEGVGARTMIDSSGNGLNGTIGNEVLTGEVTGGETAYRYTRLAPNTPPAHPEHIIRVPDSSRLDPGTRDFAITIRYRTTASFGNMIQKGQSGAQGGYFKWQNPKGVVQCMFRGSAGQNGVSTGRALNDGQWHTIKCERTATSVAMWIDGVFHTRKNGATGNISNTWPLTIGGKHNCDQIEVTCDYFAGLIARVQIDAS